jgi:spore coat protein CotH
MSSWKSGNYKLPFKLKFDEYEDDYEEIDNQRFYGFKKLSFSSNYLDDSLLHEKLASESFEAAGIIAPQTAFYRVYVDHGDGPEYFGMYTAVENVDDTLIDSFGDDSGNVYEAEGE